MNPIELRGIVKRVPGRPVIHTKPRKKITAELDAEGVAHLDQIAANMDITRTEALDQAIAFWNRKVGGVREQE